MLPYLLKSNPKDQTWTNPHPYMVVVAYDATSTNCTNSVMLKSSSQFGEKVCVRIVIDETERSDSCCPGTPVNDISKVFSVATLFNYNFFDNVTFAPGVIVTRLRNEEFMFLCLSHANHLFHVGNNSQLEFFVTSLIA
ncbi:hypothetical protein MAR_011496 [Mya arenaria]|uniref:Uncharacterized protein n=1 Tax=Mya arenaria TaxID=6604 RepID=A0ABY7FUG9_MYAAR|nr:hypothetical protein MAR_011496 [Mya arenaria]